MENLTHATKVFAIVFLGIILAGMTASCPMPYTPIAALFSWSVLHILGKFVFKLWK